MVRRCLQQYSYVWSLDLHCQDLKAMGEKVSMFRTENRAFGLDQTSGDDHVRRVILLPVNLRTFDIPTHDYDLSHPQERFRVMSSSQCQVCHWSDCNNRNTVTFVFLQKSQNLKMCRRLGW